MRPSLSHQPFCLLLAAALCAAGMWTYAGRVLIPYQISDAAAHGRPRGNLSDLYPRWLGARELLLHGRDPYSPKSRAKFSRVSTAARLIRTGPEIEITSRDSTIPSTSPSSLRPPSIFRLRSCERDSSGSCSGSPWPRFRCGCECCAGPRRCGCRRAWSYFTIGSLPVMQGLKLQQMTLFVVALVAIAMALLVSDRPIAAGIAAGVGHHQAATGLAVVVLADDLDPGRLAPALPLGRVISVHHGHPVCCLGVVPAALDSPLLAGDSRIPELHRGRCR